ncbi:MAG: CO dehydrogenase/acetyl-CoA synthase complex subunit epsilon [Thermoproteota archaeon]|nr:MAG: CO dehydrogenase/acetyl-CoA synthase complex subunit epsilon [Candidatus Korarchaeota archaeon]
MMKFEPFQTAEIPGPLKAIPVERPQTVAGIIKNAKRPIVIMGSKTFDIAPEKTLKDILEISKEVEAEVVVTGGINKKFEEIGVKEFKSMRAMELADRLRDPEWKGFDGKGNYDLAIFVGFRYYYSWLILSGLKHFSPEGFKTLSIDPYYQPHATFSLYNMKIDAWASYISSIKESLKRKG